MQSSAAPTAPIATFTKDVAVTTTTTSFEHHDNVHQMEANQAAYQANLMSDASNAIPQPVPSKLLKEVESAKGKVPHAHHVDLKKVEHSSVPVGHVQKDPSLLDKVKAKLSGHKDESSSSAVHSLPPRDDIPHSALPDSTLNEIHNAKGHVPHAHHVDIKKVEAHAMESTHVGKVKADPNIFQRATEFLVSAVPEQRPNVPKTALANTGILKEVADAKGKPAHAHHVDIQQVEAAHAPTGLGHVVDAKEKKLTTTKPAKDIESDSKPSMMDKMKDALHGNKNETHFPTIREGNATTAPPVTNSAVNNATSAAQDFSSDPSIAKFNTHNAL